LKLEGQAFQNWRMKRSKLIIEYEYDFTLYGLISLVKGYKLAWEINQVLHIQLIKQPDLVVGFKKEEEKKFSYYAHETQFNRLKLFRNKSIEGDSGKYFLIPEFPHFDFIILADMKESIAPNQLQELIKSIPSVQLVSVIPTEGLKSKSNFIF
jgi:hypothetical protein